MSFQPGDVVLLKGSQHKMCVKSIQGPTKIGVIYFDGGLKLCEAQFSTAVLQHYEGPDQQAFAGPATVRRELDKRAQEAGNAADSALTPKGKHS